MMNTKQHILVAIGAFLGALSVVAGAFGTHTLQTIVSESRIETFETATRYLLIHSLVIVIAGFISTLLTNRSFAFAGWIILSGAIVFSGSLILLVLLDLPVLGAITPIGGILLISGWLYLGVASLRTGKN